MNFVLKQYGKKKQRVNSKEIKQMHFRIDLLNDYHWFGLYNVHSYTKHCMLIRECAED